MSDARPSHNPNPPFQTPDPGELQSEENQAAVRNRLIAEQGAELDVNPDIDEDNILSGGADPMGFGSNTPPPAAD